MVSASRLMIVSFLSHLQEICQTPALFPVNINLAHVKQGLLGDCWFLCACTFLLKNKHLLNKVEQQECGLICW